MLAQVLLGDGQADAALAEIAESAAGYRAYAFARAYAVLEHESDSLAALAPVEDSFGSEQAYNIAGVYALLGKPDQAFAWLDRSYREHDSTLIGHPPITVDPDVESSR